MGNGVRVWVGARRRGLGWLLRLVLVVVLVGLAAAPQWPPMVDQEAQILAVVRGQRFDFTRWLAGAAAGKISADLGANHDYLSEPARDLIVRGYLGRLRQVLDLEAELERLFADPSIDDPQAAAAALRAEIARRRADLVGLQSLAEAIVQQQVAAVLLDEGFALGGRVWPPVRMRLTPLPTLLVVSPRDRILQLKTAPLETGLTAAERDRIEREIAERLDLSAYVTNIGGLGVYPTMVLETTDLNVLVDVIAHEWAHIWFGQFPVGWRYFRSPEMRTINETAAGIIGREVGRAVVGRFYPDLAPPPAAPAGQTPPPAAGPPPFDFRLEMRQTRIRVDELLAAGEIEAAEQYMEERRQVFVANGYHLRVLNQAYFAFTGAYADEPGAAGSDPVGPLVLQLRAASPSLKAFMTTLAFIDSLEALQAAVSP